MKKSSSAAPLQDIVRPAFAITVNGSALAMEAALRVSRVCVDEDAGFPGMFAVEIAGGDDDDETAWIDDGTFGIGTAVEIKMGYDDSLQTLISAEITGLEPTFVRGGRPSLTVRGHDRRHRLLRGKKTRSFVQQKDSDIASTIASEAGLTAAATDSQVTHEYVLQANQTDMDFLLEFYPRLSTMGQLTEMKVRGWSPKDKKELVGQAAAGAEVSTMGGQE